MNYLDFLNNDDEEENDNSEEENDLNSLDTSSHKYHNPTATAVRSNVGSYGDESRVKDYLNLSRSEDPSLAIRRKYVENKPKEEDYAPSFGRKALAALVGTLSGLRNPALGAKVSGDIVKSPYNKALKDYQEENPLIEQEARAADIGRTRDLAARKFELEEGRRKTDAETNQAFREKQLEATGENRRVTAGAKLQKDLQAQERQKVLDARDARNFALRERVASGLQSDREQNQKIKVEEKRAKLLSARAQFAKIRAHESVKSKPEYAQYFKDPNDPTDFSLKDNLPENKAEEIQFMIRDMEDTLRKSLGVNTGNYLDTGQD